MDGRPFGYRMQLFSQTGYNLTIKSTGDIVGTQDDSDQDSHIEISSGGDVSLVRLLGTNSNLYVCYASNGEIYGEYNNCFIFIFKDNTGDPSNTGTVFIEEFHGSYSAYKSVLYPEWYIGIKKNGLPKKGFRTKYGQKAIKFLPRRL
ncbi:hypothetical protein NQ318_022390 [Aromia moschata]|uniref:Fibroblast growth factor n=1 Tax=Aromia moschata TaxID=1265417 RepID=A0AAV8Z6U7_9CUCU|nr:hypothetical protein NQ318_022390 [Aromia moschata]